jgi:putative transposase
MDTSTSRTGRGVGAGDTEQRQKYKTCRRYDVPGDAHALTFSCFRQQAFLARDRTRQWLVEALAAARQKHTFDLWAYVIMPEHVHLLIFPRKDDYSIAGILLDIKRPVARQALRYVTHRAPSFLKQMRDEQPNGLVRHRFWQRGGGYDRNLNCPKTIHATLAYIHENPVRRQLVDRAESWGWSSAAYYLDGADVPLMPDRESIPPLDHVIG